MKKTLTKREIVNALKVEMVQAIDSTHNNESHNSKGALIMLEKVEKHLKDNLLYNLSVSEKGYINKGELFEITYNHYRKNYITEKAPKNKKDSTNKKYSELKCLVNCHSTIDLTPNELSSNKGMIILLNDSCLYYLNMDNVKKHINELKIYKNAYRLTNTFVRQYGVIKDNNY